MSLLATPPTVTTTGPVVAPVGTGTAMEPAFQLVGVATVPLNRTVLVPCVAPKFAPAIVTAVATAPEAGDRPVMLGAGPTSVTVQVKVALFVNALSETVAVTLYAPALVDVSVPDMSPVVGFTLSVAGSPVALYVRGLPSGSLATNANEIVAFSALV
jgi:hypothetical protein